ncbi:MAG: hypothetical protein MUD10_01590 [Candidatus Pacebacteria bacterium]|jgi:DNA-binding Lrp family transcriptional regulator|nr:hypothetical protein [Candidatus Paceibacterota bacterium]
MPKIWRKAIENELDSKDVEILNLLAAEKKFTTEEIGELAKKTGLVPADVEKRLTALKDKKVLLKDRISVIDPMKIWDGYYVALIKTHLVPPIISEDIKFPTGWRVESYLERLRRREKETGGAIIRQAYCLQGTEYDMMLIVSALSQTDLAEYLDGLTKEGWIERVWSFTPVELGDNWVFDPVAVPANRIFEERVKNIKK